MNSHAKSRKFRVSHVSPFHHSALFFIIILKPVIITHCFVIHILKHSTLVFQLVVVRALRYLIQFLFQVICLKKIFFGKLGECFHIFHHKKKPPRCATASLTYFSAYIIPQVDTKVLSSKSIFVNYFLNLSQCLNM